MSIYEAIGMAWVVFTAAIATVEILYLAFVGLREVTTRSSTILHVNQEYTDGLLKDIEQQEYRRAKTTRS